MKRKKYTGEINEYILQFLEKYGYDESQLYTDSKGKLYVLVEENDNIYHPDDLCQSGVYEHYIDEE